MSEETGVETDSEKRPKMTIAEAMDIGHASEVLKRAVALVNEAYSLITNDMAARKYLTFDATVSWASWAREQITETYDAEFNTDADELHHLRAFNGFGLQSPVHIADGACCGGKRSS